MLNHPLLAENSLFKLIGEIFHPLFELFGLILAGLYAVWPNYGFAITGPDHHHHAGADAGDREEHQVDAGDAAPAARDEEAPGQVQGPGEPGDCSTRR